jgi:hypothetical protein
MLRQPKWLVFTRLAVAAAVVAAQLTLVLLTPQPLSKTSGQKIEYI